MQNASSGVVFARKSGGTKSTAVFLLIVIHSALANPVLFENLLEEQLNLKEQLCNALFVAGTGAVFSRIIRLRRIDRFACLFSATVAVSVVIIVKMTESFNYTVSIAIFADSTDMSCISVRCTGRSGNKSFIRMLNLCCFCLFNENFSAN